MLALSDGVPAHRLKLWCNWIRSNREGDSCVAFTQTAQKETESRKTLALNLALKGLIIGKK